MFAIGCESIGNMLDKTPEKTPEKTPVDWADEEYDDSSNQQIYKRFDVDAVGNKFEFEITTENYINVVVPSDAAHWVNATIDSNDTSSLLTIVVESNDSDKKREAKLQLVDSDANVVGAIDICQKGNISDADRDQKDGTGLEGCEFDDVQEWK